MRKQHQEDLQGNKSITKLADTFRNIHKQQINEDKPLEDNQNTPPPQKVQDETNAKHPYMHFERINKKKRWQNNKRAGRFYEETQKNYIDQKRSFQWLQNGELKAKLEFWPELAHFGVEVL